MVGRGGRAVPEKVRIGGVEQWILERGENRRNPVLLCLHGGPGTSQLTRNRRCTRALEKYFTVVDWDQRGAGKSYAAIADERSMRIDRFVEDTREVTDLLLARHDQQRLVLLGHSWGSAIGVLAAARHPQLFSCYVGTGQIARMVDGEAESYAWVLAEAKRQGSRRAVAELERIGPPPYQGDWRRATIKERRYLARFGGEVYGSRVGAMRPVLSGLVFSRDYSLVDRMNYFRGILGSMRLLWPELLTLDLFAQVPRLSIPVFLLEGRHDHEAPARIAEEWFEALEAPRKEIFWFERSAHMVQTEEPERFNQLLLDKVLPVAATSDETGGP